MMGEPDTFNTKATTYKANALKFHTSSTLSLCFTNGQSLSSNLLSGILFPIYGKERKD